MSTNVPCPRTHTYTYTASILSVSILKVTFIRTFVSDDMETFACIACATACIARLHKNIVRSLFIRKSTFVRTKVL